MPDESSPSSETRPEPRPPVARAVVKPRRGPSAVWLVPLVALLIGVFLVYKAFSERGPTVSIVFKSAEGIEAGKTQVKYKDVQVGTVSDVSLSDDLTHVVVTADFVKGAEAYLTERTRFWVVKARVSAGRVTGLGTLFSGAYIGMDPSTAGKRARRFRGLETPPVVTSADPGRLFVLRSSSGGAYEVGAPVYYRGVRVGEIVSSDLDPEDELTTVRVFVHAPYDRRVTTRTRFWDSGGIDVEIDSDGIRVDTESVVSLMIGGIAFGNPESLEPGDEPGKDAVFPLYENRRAALSPSYAIKRRYLLQFQDSVEGLEPGAPVVFQGIELGTVLDVRLEFDRESLDFRIPVLIQLEPERVAAPGDVSEDPGARVRALVERGLRARLKSGNLITGKKEIELVMQADAEPGEVVTRGDLLEIPTVSAPLEEITARLGNIAERLDEMPLEDIGENLRLSLARLAGTLENTERLTERLDSEVLPHVSAAAAEASQLVGPTSPLNAEVRQLLVELTETARSLRLMAEYLERHPEALIRGKEEAR